MGRKLIYAFDFDGTIVTNKFPEIGTPILNTIELIKKVKSEGHYIILNTMRESDLLNEAVEYCKKLEIVFDTINDNLPHMKEFYNNNPRKIFANYYVDDHNLFVYGVNDCSDDIKEMQDMIDYYKHEYFAEYYRNKELETGVSKACERLAEICKDSKKCNGLYCPHDRINCMYQCENAENWKEWCLSDDNA